MYIITQTNNLISRYNLTSNTLVSNWKSTGNNPRGLTIVYPSVGYGKAYGFVANYGPATIDKFEMRNIEFPGDTFGWATATQGINSNVNSTNDGTYLYTASACGSKISSILLSNPSSYTSTFINTGYSNYGVTVFGGFIYTDTTVGIIQKWNAATGASVNSNWASFSEANGNTMIFTNDGTYLYAMPGNGVNIYRYNLSNGVRNPAGVWYNSGGGPTMTIYGNYLYTNTNLHNIVRVNLSNASATVIYSNANLTYNYGIAYDGTYFYLSDQNGHAIHRYDSSANTFDLNWRPLAYGSSPCGITIAFTTSSTIYGYVNNFGSNTIDQFMLAERVAYPCFKRDTKILTNQGYIPIQRLKKGHLVKTLNDGFVPVCMLGKSTIQHNASEERIKTQLYRCPKSAYPELTEDLVLTGCHSILVKKFKNAEERQSTIVVNGNIYSTDNLYRLPACVDTRAVVYETPGEYTIYHLALENEDYYMNYGIYANGLLVESCSKRYLKELSNMKLISQ